ncbi:MAG: alpha/beta hydrolase, partial [Acidobacteria bacterium]|nr:alpha/beta hydrolase [Acidobacteriota bacterium]
YTHYLYEKIFGEPFLRQLPAETLQSMRGRFHERYKDRVFCLVRLTEAQDPFFEGLEERLDEYRGIDVPVLIVGGTQDRAIPLWQQEKLCSILPRTRLVTLSGAGHVVYLEKRREFFTLLRAFLGAGSTDFELPPQGEEG